MQIVYCYHIYTLLADNYPESGGYFLAANSFHISRISLNGSSIKTLHTDPLSGIIVGLDYHYSEGYMYWSDVRHGTLNRALLNGSNDEVLLYTDDPVIGKKYLKTHYYHSH
jgi:hypothetical protein